MGINVAGGVLHYQRGSVRLDFFAGLQRAVKTEQRHIQPVGQLASAAGVVGVFVGNDYRLGGGLESFERAGNVVKMSRVVRAGIDNQHPGCTNQVGIGARPGHRRGVGGN